MARNSLADSLRTTCKFGTGVLLLAAMGGCSGAVTSQSSKLDRLKVLALVVDTPAVQNPLGTVNVSLDPYISDVTGSGTLSLAVQSCLDPGGVDAPNITCDSALYPSAVQNVVVSPTTTAGDGVFGTPERTGRLPTGSITVPLQIPSGFLATYPAFAQFNGVPFVIVVKVISAKETVQMSRKIFVSTQVANHNPGISDLLANGTPLTDLPTTSPELSLSYSSGPEGYQWMPNDGGPTRTAIENYDTTWYVSDGSMKTPRTQTNQTAAWNAPTTKPVGRKIVVVGVLRDNRGGESVIIKKF